MIDDLVNRKYKQRKRCQSSEWKQLPVPVSGLSQRDFQYSPSPLEGLEGLNVENRCCNGDVVDAQYRQDEVGIHCGTGKLRCPPINLWIVSPIVWHEEYTQYFRHA